jgi:hypothetical protein
MKLKPANTITKTLLSDTRYIVILLTIVTIIFTGQINAATYTVDNNSDDGTLTACTSSPNDCSLRGAITNANYSPNDDLETDLIEFNAAMTITLGGTPLTVSGNRPLTITGLNTVTVSGNNLSNVFEAVNKADLTLSGLTITDGKHNLSYSGGNGITNNGGTITIVNSTVSGNKAGVGGGIFNKNGNVFLINSVVKNNKALYALGIYNENGILTVIDSTIADNSELPSVCGGCGSSGAGIYNYLGTVNIVNSTISRNWISTAGRGGGIFNQAGTINLTNSTISGNQTGSGSSGSGIHNTNKGIVNLVNTTVYNNPGGNIFNHDGLLVVQNSIIAAGNIFFGWDIYGGRVISQGNNIIGTNYQTSITGNTDGNINVESLNLAPLGFYGGKNETHALLSDSPAVNPASSNNAPAFDQRGGSRNGTADIGAFEMGSDDVVAELPSGKVNSAYSQTVVLYTVVTNYCVSSGNLPPGLSGIPACSMLTRKKSKVLSAVEPTLQLSGMPTTPGTYNFTIKASLGTGFSETNYKIIVGTDTINSKTIQ